MRFSVLDSRKFGLKFLVNRMFILQEATNHHIAIGIGAITDHHGGHRHRIRKPLRYLLKHVRGYDSQP